MKLRRIGVVASVVALTFASFLPAAVSASASSTAGAEHAHAGKHKTWTVWPGTGTISAAVAKAHPGDTLKLRRGTFLDSVLVTIPLTIRGSGWSTVIKPPPSPSPSNFCDSPSVEGLCVVGTVD